MTKKYTYSEKSNGQTLSAEEWNNLAQDVDAAVNAITNIQNNSSGGSADPHIIFDSEGKHNLTIKTTVNDQQYSDGGDKLKGGNINIEPVKDFQVKPGDEIAFYAHHRKEGDNDQVTLQILTENSAGDDIAAKLKVSSGDITITNKDAVSAYLVTIATSYKKTPDYTESVDVFDGSFESGKIYDASYITTRMGTILTGGQLSDATAFSNAIQSIFDQAVGKTKVIKAGDNYYKFKTVSKADGVTNVNIEDASGYGYLKLRAQSIDLRCEDHGGIAIQPKGYDGDLNMNKIKFEHGGGDGLEFGTFNTEHTSLFTGDYRFNKNGTIKLATRTTVASDKADPSDSTTAYKYVKAADDFYDNIAAGDPTCTWEDVVNTANLITTYELDDQNNTIDGGVLKVKGINNNTTNTLTITTANPSTGTVEDYVIPVYTDPASDPGGLLSTRYNPQVIASCSINDIIMFVNWAKGTGFGPWDAQAIANKEELQWNGHEFASLNAIENNEHPIAGPQ